MEHSEAFDREMEQRILDRAQEIAKSTINEALERIFREVTKTDDIYEMVGWEMQVEVVSRRHADLPIGTMRIDSVSGIEGLEAKYRSY